MFQTTLVQKSKTHFILSNTFFHKFLGITWQLKKVGNEYTSLYLHLEKIHSCIETACLELFKSSVLLKRDVEVNIKSHTHTHTHTHTQTNKTNEQCKSKGSHYLLWMWQELHWPNRQHLKHSKEHQTQPYDRYDWKIETGLTCIKRQP
jgi:hypothetical protein